MVVGCIVRLKSDSVNNTTFSARLFIQRCPECADGRIQLWIKSCCALPVRRCGYRIRRANRRRFASSCRVPCPVWFAFMIKATCFSCWPKLPLAAGKVVLSVMPVSAAVRRLGVGDRLRHDAVGSSNQAQTLFPWLAGYLTPHCALASSV